MFPVDAHVHLYAPERVEPSLDAAAAHFDRVSGPRAGAGGALLLAQAQGEEVFEWLCTRASVGAWRIEPVADEPHSVVARRGAARILVVCGRQIRAERGLEVLALGTTRRYREGEAVEDTLEAVQASGALAGLPWAFGKWTGARGNRIRTLIERSNPKDFFLGDNGGRLRLAPRPRLLDEGAARGHRILPGSDPFPFGGDFRRVGGFGCLVQPSSDAPDWKALRGALTGRRDPRPYGPGVGMTRFGYNQIGIQLYTRLRRGKAA